MATTTNIGKAHVVRGHITVADAKTGAIIVPARATQTIIVTDFWCRAVGGSAATLTALELQSSVTNDVIVSAAQTALTSGTVLRPETSNVTATNLNQSIGATNQVPEGEGLSLVSTGTQATTATSFDYYVEYIYVAA